MQLAVTFTAKYYIQKLKKKFVAKATYLPPNGALTSDGA